MIIWLLYMGILLYWEAVYHISSFGVSFGNPWPAFVLLSIVAAIQAFITGCVCEKHKRKIFWSFMVPEYLIFAVQTVYYTIFRQPLLLKAMVMGGQDALTNYWKEALMGILKASPILVLLALPLTAVLFVFYYRKQNLPVFEGIQKVRLAFLFGISLLVCWMTLEIGRFTNAEDFQEYTEFYAPDLVLRDMGLLVMIQRDLSFEMETAADQILLIWHGEDSVAVSGSGPSEKESLEEEIQSMETSVSNEGSNSSEETLNSEESSIEEGTGEQEENHSSQVPEPEEIPAFNTIELELGKLAELSAGDKEKEWLSTYIANEEPTGTNEYTGLFEGYNLIFLTAEGFSTYAISEEFTPTLYKLVNSGFVFTDYYVPLWQTSTSDGEYVNLTGLIPDGQFSMSKSAENNMGYCLPGFFDEENCVNQAYHNNSLSYYERHLSHPNLGYDFKASKLGELSEAEWGHKIFPMENPGKWPSSDLEMIQTTLPEYIQAERFNVYYMTISGHMYYSFTGNSMSAKNKEAVAGLEMSENARAYIACNIELDKALEYLLTELENAGKLENTVIALSADHYPYAMTEEQYEELAGRDLSNDRDLYRNSLILWNAGMEESVTVDKPCCSVDILPTLLNLFGYDYDSRMYAGRDILSDAEGLVIFNDRSFVTDTVVYDRTKKTTTWRKELSEEEKEQYLERMKQEVKDRYQFSAYVLREDYYALVKQCESGQEE